MFGILILLILAVITGIISFGGFLVGTTLLLLGKGLFFIFLVLFIISLIRRLTTDNTKHHH